MASPRMLSKLVATMSGISAGALAALRRDRALAEGRADAAPPIVRSLMRMLSETIAVGSHPPEETVAAVQAHIASLVERYGTLRSAVEALGGGGRRHALISQEKAHAWSVAMLSSVAQVESALKRSPVLMLNVQRWIAAQGEALEPLLDSYQQWLSSPVDDAPWQQPVAAEPASAPAAGAERAPAEAGSSDIHTLRRALLDRKPLLHTGAGVRHAGPAAARREDAVRALVEEGSAHARAVAAVAEGRWREAESILAELRGAVHEADLWTLWGDRYFFESRFDDAVEPYRAARAARDDLCARLNLAAALVRARRAPTEQQTLEAIDLLSDSLRTLSGEGEPRALTEGALGSAWMAHPAGDRDANLRRAIEHLESGLQHAETSGDDDLRSELHMELGAAWLSLPSGKKLENVQRAITCFERAGQVWTREAHPDRWAMLQNNLGHAWEHLPAGDRASNMQRAIGHYEAALTVRTREADPVGWAMLQNNLGNAWVQIPGGDHRANILRAIEHHQAALEVWSSHDRRLEWAATQNNLGNSWALLPASRDEREKNLRRAIAAYKAALEVRTRAAYPVEWATTQNNLGSALLHLPATGGDAAVREAISCFEKALEVRTRESYPIDWAKTQANLGNALVKLPGGDRAANLHAALEHYARALSVFTAAAHPYQHEHLSGRRTEIMDMLYEMRLMR